MQKNFNNFLSIYIHIPFCYRKCLFCSFAIAVAQEHRRDEYVKSLLDEMKKYQGRNIQSVYFGGGTPSVLDKNHFEILMNGLRNIFCLKDDIEITLEANPESINISKAEFLRSLGINRVSLGVQSLNDRYLKFLGRTHDSSMARRAYDILRTAGFSNINLDLMYGFPGQTEEELVGDLREITLLGSEHLSLYTLTIEPRSRFHASAMKLDDEEKLAGQYLLIGRFLEGKGFKQYEVSNFSKPGFQSSHNKSYWMGDPYIGVGVGAHGFDGRRRYWNTSNLQEYLKKIAHSKEAIEGSEELTDHQLVMERILFGLRMNDGIPWEIVPADKQGQIELWIKDGFFLREGGNLKTTDKGRLVLDELSSRLI